MKLLCWFGLHDWRDFQFTHMHVDGLHLMLACARCGLLRTGAKP